MNSSLKCLDVFSALCLVFAFNLCFTPFQPFSKEGCQIRQLEGFVETRHLHAFRIHLCPSSESRSSVKDHERLVCPMFALPRSKGFLDDTPCICLSPLRPLCHYGPFMNERLRFLGLQCNARSPLLSVRHHGLFCIQSINTGSMRCP